MKKLTQDQMIFSRGGHSLLELMLVLIVSSMLTAIGFHVLQTMVVNSREQQLRDSDQMLYQTAFDSFQYAFDKRINNPFSEDPWLTILTGDGSDWYPMKKLELKIIENETITNWEWIHSGSISININIRGNSYYPGESPGRIVFQFPDSITPQFSNGIALEGI